MSDVERKPFWVKCADCDHECAAAYTPMEVTAFARTIGNATCPNCGAASRKIFTARHGDARAQEGERA